MSSVKLLSRGKRKRSNNAKIYTANYLECKLLKALKLLHGEEDHRMSLFLLDFRSTHKINFVGTYNKMPLVGNHFCAGSLLLGVPLVHGFNPQHQ